MQPNKLEPNVYSRITVVLADTQAELLQNLYRTTFEPGEYYFPVFSELPEEPGAAAVALYDQISRQIIDNKLQRPSITQFQLVCYAALDQNAPARTAWLLQLAQRCRMDLDPGIRSYLCLLRPSFAQEGIAAYMDACVEACDGGSELLSTPIFLLSPGLGVQLRSSLKASVRLMHILSRNNVLSGALIGDPNRRLQLVNDVMMTEYDVEAVENIQRRIAEIDGRLGNNALPDGLEDYLREVTERIRKRFSSTQPLNLDYFPVRADAVGNLFSVLFSRARLQRALGSVSEALRLTYGESVHKRCCEDCLTDEDVARIRDELQERFSLSFIQNELPQAVRRYADAHSREYRPHSPALYPCCGMKRLREQLAEQYQMCLRASGAYMESAVLHRVGTLAAELSISPEIETQRNRLLQEKEDKKGQLHDIGGTGDAQNYLSNLASRFGHLSGLRYRTPYNDSCYMLVSQSTDDNWQKEGYDKLITQQTVHGIYNYGSLEQQEFQSLRIVSFLREHYESSRELMFPTVQQG